MDIIFHIESHEEFQKVLREVLNTYYCSINRTLPPKDSSVITSAKNDLKRILRDSNFDTNKVPDLLANKGWDGEKITFFVNLLNEKKKELLYASITHQNSEYGETITSFDWVLKLVLGTSELNTLKYPLLQLTLSTDYNDTQKNLIYDMNKDLLQKTIDVLEKLLAG